MQPRVEAESRLYSLGDDGIYSIYDLFIDSVAERKSTLRKKLAFADTHFVREQSNQRDTICLLDIDLSRYGVSGKSVHHLLGGG